MPSDVALTGVPEPVGSGTAFSPLWALIPPVVLEQDRRGSWVLTEIGCGGSVADTGLGLPRLIGEDSLTACIMLLHPTPYSRGTLRFAREKTRLDLGRFFGAPG